MTDLGGVLGAGVGGGNFEGGTANDCPSFLPTGSGGVDDAFILGEFRATTDSFLPLLIEPVVAAVFACSAG